MGKRASGAKASAAAPTPKKVGNQNPHTQSLMHIDYGHSFITSVSRSSPVPHFMYSTGTARARTRRAPPTEDAPIPTLTMCNLDFRPLNCFASAQNLAQPTPQGPIFGWTIERFRGSNSTMRMGIFHLVASIIGGIISGPVAFVFADFLVWLEAKGTQGEWSSMLLEKVAKLDAASCPFTEICGAFGATGVTQHTALFDALTGFLDSHGSTKKLLLPAGCLFPAEKVEECVGPNSCSKIARTKSDNNLDPIHNWASYASDSLSP